jgi:hypothetical protein
VPDGITCSAWLATLDDVALEALLRARPEALARPPRTLTDLAGLLGNPAYVTEALRQLDRGAVQVAGVLGVLGPSSAKEVTAALARSGTVPAGHVDDALARLVALALAWPDPAGAWRVPKAVVGLAPALCGLGTPLPTSGVARIVATVRTEPSPGNGAAVITPEPVFMLVGQIRDLLVHLDRTPVKPLQSGGIGVQEQRRLAKVLGLDQDGVRRLLFLAGDAGLLSIGSKPGLVTTGGAAWLAQGEVPAAIDLLIAAVEATRTDNDQAAPLWGPSWHRSSPTLRQALESLVERPLRSPLPLLTWRWYGATEAQLAATVAALEALGLVTSTGAQPWAAPIVAADRVAAEAALAAALPPEQDDVVLQADGTAVVASRPSAALRGLLDRIARRESERTWRIEADRLRDALDRGASGAELLDQLRSHSRHRVPQVLEQLIHDAVARHGRIVVTPSATLLRVDDEPLAITLLRDKKLRALDLTQVQQGVLTSSKKPAEVLAALRSAGHSPAGPAESGRNRPAAAKTASYAYRTASPADVVRSLRKGTAEGHKSRTHGPLAAVVPIGLAQAAPGGPFDHLPVVERLLLVRALSDRRPIEIDYIDAGGSRTTRVVDDLDVDGALLVGWCHLRESERHFSPDGIMAVRPSS